MGRPKALLPVAGTTLIEFQLARLAPFFAEVLLSANDPAAIPSGLPFPVVTDLHRRGGPLAGIEAVLHAASQETVIVVACDMPHVDARFLRLLADRVRGHDAAVPFLGGRAHPACAAYRTSAAGAIAAALGEGRLRLTDALEELDVIRLEKADLEPFGSDLLTNLNSPGDYEAFLGRIRPDRGPAHN